MSFILDKEQVKPGLIIFRRGDVERPVLLPRADSERGPLQDDLAQDIGSADGAGPCDGSGCDIRFRVKHDVPVFNRPFSQVAEEYAGTQQRRANAGEVSQARAMNVKNKVN